MYTLYYTGFRFFKLSSRFRSTQPKQQQKRRIADLGPMLILIYINDLPDSLLSCIKLFADDTKLYRVVSTQHDKQELQCDVQKVMDWSETQKSGNWLSTGINVQSYNWEEIMP